MLAPFARQNDAANCCDPTSATFVLEGVSEPVAVHAGVTLTFAVPVFELSATLVAVIVTVAGDGGTAGAVYTAAPAGPGTIVPNVELPPAIPLTLQITPGVALPIADRVDVKACPPPAGTVTLAGETVTTILSWSAIVADSLAELSAALTAVIVTFGADSITPGAV
jgi:hypothetical protein